MKAFVVSRGQSLTLITPYDPAFLDSLKFSIPIPCRKYDPENRSWTVYQPYCKIALLIVREHFDDYEALRPLGERDVAASMAEAHSTDECVEAITNAYPNHAMLMVLPPVGPHQALHREVVRAAYRALSRLLHPDRNPDPGAKVDQQRLNAAFEAVSRA